MEALKSTVLFLTLSPYSIEQQDMLNRLSMDNNLEKVDSCAQMIKLLLKKEIASYPVPHQDEIESWETFKLGDLSSHWKDIFRVRIIQHNIRVAAMYYRQIHGTRLAQLLGLAPEELEAEVANMVSNREVYAKIDRPNNIIRFAQKKNPEAVLTDWASDISSLLHLVETTS